MNFKDYYDKLPSDEARNLIRDIMWPKYMGYSSFYRKIKDNTFTELEFEKLEEITGETFTR